MTTSTGPAPANLVPFYRDPEFQCDGARIRKQYRRLATVVTISGIIDAGNVDRVSEYSRRFILADTAFILDLSGVESFAAQGVSFLSRVDDECRAAGMQWALIASDEVGQTLRIANDEARFPVAGSVCDALREFADAIFTRRRLLLPLLSKNA